MRNKPVYRSEVSVYDGIHLLRIWDLYCDSAPTMTVTNGAEIVLSELQATIGKLPTLIIYKDSSDEWDRLVWNVNYASFRSLAPGIARTNNDEKAMILAVEIYKQEQANG